METTRSLENHRGRDARPRPSRPPRPRSWSSTTERRRSCPERTRAHRRRPLGRAGGTARGCRGSPHIRGAPRRSACSRSPSDVGGGAGGAKGLEFAFVISSSRVIVRGTVAVKEEVRGGQANALPRSAKAVGHSAGRFYFLRCRSSPSDRHETSPACVGTSRLATSARSVPRFVVRASWRPPPQRSRSWPSTRPPVTGLGTPGRRSDGAARGGRRMKAIARIAAAGTLEIRALRKPGRSA